MDLKSSLAPLSRSMLHYNTIPFLAARARPPLEKERSRRLDIIILASPALLLLLLPDPSALPGVISPNLVLPARACLLFASCELLAVIYFFFCSSSEGDFFEREKERKEIMGFEPRVLMRGGIIVSCSRGGDFSVVGGSEQFFRA